MLFLVGILWSSFRLTISEDVKNAFAFLGVIAILSYLFFYHNQIIAVRNDYANDLASPLGFFFHYIFFSVVAIGGWSKSYTHTATERVQV